MKSHTLIVTCKVPLRRGLVARQTEGKTLTSPAEAVVTADETAGLMTAPTKPTSEKLLALVLSSLDDDKAIEVVQIDLRGKTQIGDHMVVASGRSTRQVSAMAEKLVDRVKKAFEFTPKVEGKDTGDWVLIDTGDVIVHIFRPEVREFYQLEKMWQPGGEPSVAN